MLHLSMLRASKFTKPSANAWASPILDASMSNMLSRWPPTDASVTEQWSEAEGSRTKAPKLRPGFDPSSTAAAT